MYVPRPEPLQDGPACDTWMGGDTVPLHLRECYREQGRRQAVQQQGAINWGQIVAGASVGLIATVIGHNIIKKWM